MPVSDRDASQSVLLVDDDVFVLDAMGQLLGQAGGFVIHRASSHATALACLRELPQLDVIVSDVVLAGVATGLELCREAVARFPRIGVVVITGDSSDFSDGIPERGIYLRKPFSADKLMRSILAVIERK